MLTTSSCLLFIHALLTGLIFFKKKKERKMKIRVSYPRRNAFNSTRLYRLENRHPRTTWSAQFLTPNFATLGTFYDSVIQNDMSFTSLTSIRVFFFLAHVLYIQLFFFPLFSKSTRLQTRCRQQPCSFNNHCVL